MEFIRQPFNRSQSPKTQFYRHVFCIVYDSDQQMHNIYINNEYLYRKYSYMFRCIWVIFGESYFLFAKLPKPLRL
jgi:hypothetical protein